MSEIEIKAIDEVAPYSGPEVREGIRFRPLASALGVKAWGMNVLELEPGTETYPEHDHAKDGQEEVFFVVEGAAMLKADGKDHRVAAGSFVRIPPDVTRKWRAGQDGVTILAIGATPGKAYEPRH